ncbi:uncharacterized protein J3D65DRAFT_50487 [Phyllosticta citribraziliensis]|uniref:Uncharacterized protein n=1 Tax=Phyllosticta citribraziliensis TaxID=989973 RepID=A0ABR1MEW2_9PEZI
MPWPCRTHHISPNDGQRPELGHWWRRRISRPTRQLQHHSRRPSGHVRPSLPASQPASYHPCPHSSISASTQQRTPRPRLLRPKKLDRRGPSSSSLSPRPTATYKPDMSVFCAWRFLGLFQLAAHDAARAAQKQTKRDVESRRRTDGQAGGRTDGCSPATATATATGAPQGNVTQRNPARLRTPPTHRTRPELFWWVLRPAAAAGASVHGRCKSVVSFTAAAGECCFFFAGLFSSFLHHSAHTRWRAGGQAGSNKKETNERTNRKICC